ncbi:MAG: DUF4837 family protein [Bacteroidetes bacterium]|nr:DUF4837 family protein [Bacteroidota bacterium]
MNKHIVVLLLLLFSLTSCKNTDEKKYLKNSLGNPYEMFLVMKPDLWNGEIGHSVKKAMTVEDKMLNFSEPAFDVLYVTSKSFRGLTREHRNVVIARINKKYKKAEVLSQLNKYSQPQLLVVIQAPDSTSLSNIIRDKGDSILSMFEREEMIRFSKRVNTKGSKVVQDSIKKLFGFKMAIPSGVIVRHIIKDSMFMWNSYEMPESSQGVVIYTYPYDGKKITIKSIIKQRNHFVKLIPGALKGSYMTTSDMVKPELKIIKVRNRIWYKTRGFWNVKNDFMGGPFTSFTYVDRGNKVVYVIDNYVYSPNPHKGQRNYIRQLESIVNSVKF